MSNFEFQSCLHRNQSDMLDAIVSAWLTGGGLNTFADQRAALEAAFDGEIAAEIVQGFGLAEPDRDREDPDVPGHDGSHMAIHGYTVSDLRDAARRARVKMASLSVYAVDGDGDVEETLETMAEDGGVLVVASCADEAKEMLREYDAGRLQPDNVPGPLVRLGRDVLLVALGPKIISL